VHFGAKCVQQQDPKPANMFIILALGCRWTPGLHLPLSSPWLRLCAFGSADCQSVPFRTVFESLPLVCRGEVGNKAGRRLGIRSVQRHGETDCLGLCSQTWSINAAIRRTSFQVLPDAADGCCGYGHP